MIRRLIYLFLATVLLGGLAAAIAYYAFDFKPKMLATIIGGSPRPPVTIATENAKVEKWQPLISGIGTVQPVEGIDVTPQVSGTVKELHFDSGDFVKKGDVLVQLNTETDEADLKNLNVQLANAEAEYERRNKVFQRGFAAKADVESLRTARDQIKASIERAQAQIALKTIVAPWDGQVGLRSISIGSFVAPGQKITWLQKTDPVFVDFQVTEADFAHVQVGQMVTARFSSAPGRTFSGKVASTDARVSDASRTITVRAEFPNPDHVIVPGMYADVQVDAGSPGEVTTVPQTAVSFSLYGDTVYVVVPAKKLDANAKDDALAVERRFVKTGEVRDGRISVTKGVATGDQVVIAGQNKLSQGATVVVNNEIALKEYDPTTVQ